jgi:hypothetical protein
MTLDGGAAIDSEPSYNGEQIPGAGAMWDETTKCTLCMVMMQESTPSQVDADGSMLCSGTPLLFWGGEKVSANEGHRRKFEALLMDQSGRSRLHKPPVFIRWEHRLKGVAAGYLGRGRLKVPL